MSDTESADECEFESDTNGYVMLYFNYIIINVHFDQGK